MFKRGDVVRIGKGKVEYTVLNDQVGPFVDIESKNTGKAQTMDNSRLTLVTPKAEKAPAEDQHIEHIPGESPAQYKARTGRKLDGRTTIYGRMILVGLQLKRTIVGETGGTAKNRKAAKRAARTKR